MAIQGGGSHRRAVTQGAKTVNEWPFKVAEAIDERSLKVPKP
jgi:hypothetical protein